MNDLHGTLAAYERVIRNDRLNVDALCKIGRELARLDRPSESRKCYKAAVDALLYAMKIGNVDAAISFELLIHRAFVAPVEEEDHYYRCYSHWRTEMARFGRRYRDPGMRVSTNVRGIGFVLPTGTLLGHTEVLFNILRECAVLESLGIAAHVYVLHDYYEPFLERASRDGIQLSLAEKELAQGPDAPELQRLAWLRAKLAEHDCAVAVWVSSPPTSTFVLSANVAPVQIFWSLRFHAISGPFVDGYVSYGPRHQETKVIGKTEWRVCPVPLALERREHDERAIAEIRQRFPERVLLGTLARPAKIDSRPFLEAVARILRENPDVGYLWTGRTLHPGIQQFFDAAGIAERCHFIGWVDTALYARALDVFLETFPLGCGITGYQALAAGTALLSYYDENTIYGMQFGIADRRPDREFPPVDASGPILCARDPDEYVALANRLIADRDFRLATGARGQAFFEAEVDNGEYYARRFFETVLAIADDTLSQKAREAAHAPDPLAQAR